MINVSMPLVAGGHNSKMLHYGQHGPYGSYGGIPGPAPAPTEKQSGVYLNMSVEPPMLEVAPPASNNMKGLRGFGRVGRVISSVQRVCSSFSLMSRSGTTWVNKDLLNSPPLPNFYASNTMEGMKNPCMYSPTPVEGYMEAPWFQLPPGGYVQMPDQFLQAMPYGMQCFSEEKASHNAFWGKPTGSLSKSQPLNPEAKEWVPKEHQSKNGIVPAQVDNSDGLGEFCEITEKEISSIREMSPGSPETPKNIANTEKQNVDKDVQCITVKFENDIVKPSSTAELTELQSEDSGYDRTSVRSESPSSYAGIVRESKDIVLNSENKEQVKPKDLTEILPRFQTSEKKCSLGSGSPEESASPKPTLPFRTGSKLQKRLSKRFFEDLKSSPSSTSSGSFSDAMESPCGSFSGDSPLGSPLSSGIPTAVLSWRMRKDSSGSSNSVGGSSTSSLRIGDNSCGIERVRTLSESSVGSVDSLDIEFDEDEVPEIKDPKPKEAGVPCKLVEGLSCVLSLLNGASDTEDDDFDDDEDWDEVDSNCDIDLTSWETFGLSSGLILPVTIPKTVQEVEHSEECGNSKEMTLKEINAVWSSEIEKDVKGQSSPKVKFVESPQVYPMVAWGFAYRASRKGIWEQYARDRERFGKRICELESVLAPVFEMAHRKKIYDKLCAGAS